MSSIKTLLLPVANAQDGGEARSLRAGPLDRFDRWTLGLIGVILLLLLARVGGLKPSMSDTWYHLTVANRIATDGAIPGWDWWHYAPTGRPHLYPPLLHLIIAFLSGFTGSVIGAGQLCAAMFFPLALLTTWYCARRLLDSRAALLAVLLMMTDMFHFVIMEAYIAGCLVNILMPVLIVSFLGRRPWWSILLMTLMYYSHLGFPHCVALGLVLFGLKYRSYLRLSLKVVCISLLFFSPWLAHVFGHLDWLAVVQKGGMPGGVLQKVLSLQAFNVVLLGLGLWGVRAAPRSVPGRMLPAYMLLGFLPILLSYGGRYTMHTMPMWAILGAGVVGGLLPAAAGRRRIIGIIGLTLLPLPSIGLFGQFGVMPITGSHMLAIVAVTGNWALGDGEKNEAYRADCEELVDWLRQNTDPDEIIYVNKVWIADMISLLADRRTDFGAWWECSKESAKLYSRALRDWAPKATFVCIKPDADGGSVLWDTAPMPGVDTRRDLGRFQIGIRKPSGLKALAPRGPRRSAWHWKALSGAGTTGEVKATRTGIRWTFDAQNRELSMISTVLLGEKIRGVRFSIRTGAMTDELVLGIRTPEGRDFRWPLSIPEAGVTYKVRAPFRWMQDREQETWSGQKVADIYLARPAAGQPRDKHTGTRVVEVGGLEPLVVAPRRK